MAVFWLYGFGGVWYGICGERRRRTGDMILARMVFTEKPCLPQARRIGAGKSP